MTDTTLPRHGEFISWDIWGGQTTTARVFMIFSDGQCHLTSASGYTQRHEALPARWYPATAAEIGEYEARTARR
jgi:hypothetical protein